MHEASQLEIFKADQDNTGTSSFFQKTNENQETEKVAGIVFDSEFHDLKRIDLIKMDIEGAELYALKGMEQAIKKHSPTIIIEISDDVLTQVDYTKADLLNFFENLNYQQFGLNTKGELIPVEEQDSDYHNYVFVKPSE